MNWSRAMCLIGKHELTKWRAIASRPIPGAITVTVGLDKATREQAMTKAYSERHCKRTGCKFKETKPLKPRRPSNFADTVTFVPIMPPKDEK